MGEGVHEKRSFRLGKIPPKGGTTNFSILALATTEKIGGRDVSRLALWRADAAQTQRVHDGRRAFTGAGRRRKYGVIQRSGRCAATDFASLRAGAVGVVRMAGRASV